MEENHYKLFLKEQIYEIPTEFTYLEDVNPDIYSILIADKRYNVKSNVTSEVFQSFIDHWVHQTTPEITPNNLHQYEELSQEFSVMQDLLQLYRKHTTTNSIITTLINKSRLLKGKLTKLNNIIDVREEKYRQIIDTLFTNFGIDTRFRFLEVKSELFVACNNEDMKRIELLTGHEIKKDKMSFILNEEEQTAGLFKNFNFNSKILIPRSIIHQSQEYPITVIYEKAFYNCKTLKSICFMEDSELLQIEDSAFSHSNLEEIFIPKKTFEIGQNSFSHCINLKRVVFSDESSFCSIGQYAFQSTGLEEVTLKSRSIQINELAFSSCKNLSCIEITSDCEYCTINWSAFSFSSIESIFISSKNLVLKSGWATGALEISKVAISSDNGRYISQNDDQIVYEKTNIYSDEYDVLCYCVRSLEDVKISPFIRRIESYAFYGSELKSIEFSEDSQLASIGSYAFSNSKIRSIFIPATVTRIEENAFYSCRKLKSIEFARNSKLKEIGINVFSNSALKSILIPSSITEIGSYAFAYCDKLRKIEFFINSELVSINSNAFVDSRIESITIPSKVVMLKQGWCAGTYSLTNVLISPKNDNYLLIDQSFVIGKSDKSKNGSFDSLVFVLRDAEKIMIPSFIQRIEPFAFNKCRQLKEIKFSEDSELQSMGENAFSYSSIEKITIPRSVKLIEKFCFKDCSNMRKIDIQANSELNLIDKFAFYLSSIRSLSIPANVKVIEKSAFSDCIKMKIIEIDEYSELKFIKKGCFRSSNLNLIMISVNQINDIKSLFINTF